MSRKNPKQWRYDKRKHGIKHVAITFPRQNAIVMSCEKSKYFLWEKYTSNSKISLQSPNVRACAEPLDQLMQLNCPHCSEAHACQRGLVRLKQSRCRSANKNRKKRTILRMTTHTWGATTIRILLKSWVRLDANWKDKRVETVSWIKFEVFSSLTVILRIRVLLPEVEPTLLEASRRGWSSLPPEMRAMLY